MKIFWFVTDLESARGLAQSKTWRKLLRSVTRVSVLECAGPPALFPTQSKAHDRPPTLITPVEHACWNYFVSGIFASGFKMSPSKSGLPASRSRHGYFSPS